MMRTMKAQILDQTPMHRNPISREIDGLGLALDRGGVLASWGCHGQGVEVE